jgi:hypothetical protein
MVADSFLLKRWYAQPHFSSVRRRSQPGLIHKIRLYLELKSNLVYGLHDSGGRLPADLPLIDSINKPHASDQVSELAKAA